MTHPNAVVGGSSGIGIGALAVWLAGLAGLDMPPEIGAVVGGAVAALALLIGRQGIVGVWRRIKFGDASPDTE